jgi:hypothetical protein
MPSCSVAPRLLAAPTLALCLLLAPRVMRGQKKPWSGVLEAAASLYQGNTDQRNIFTRTELGRADSTVEVRGSVSFGYADAARDSVPRAVTKRTWLGALALDFRPHAQVSPFFFVNYESSWEKRILDRVGIGVGAKAVILQNDVTQANVSVAILSERLRPSRLSSDTMTISAARWSGRARFRHQFDERVKLSHTTFWQPQVSDLESFTVNSTSELSFAVRESTSFTLSYLSLYDSAARARGALSNNDAQVLFGVKTGF